jgi:fido (protein-threonine AMPylation protein)
MDNLLRWFHDYQNEDPVILATWLHHRFTQIHPYQDGNGRLSRALVTMVLLRAGLLPLVIDRDLRASYILDLEAADFGDMSKLAQVFARLERDAILQALSIDMDAKPAEDNKLTSAVIDTLSEKFSRRREARFTELRKVNHVAIHLRSQANSILTKAVEELKESLPEIRNMVTFVDDGGTDRANGYYYKFEVSSSAKETGHFANFTEDHYFTKASVRISRDRFVFVVSFHHVGRYLSGVMEATAFAKLENIVDAGEEADTSENFVICAKDPFVFTHTTNTATIEHSFGRWLDAAFAIGLAEFGDRI